VLGPLSAYSAGYGSWLQTQSYSRSAISDRLWQVDQLSRWLEREGLAVGELSVEECERFAASRRGRSSDVGGAAKHEAAVGIPAGAWADADAGTAAGARSDGRTARSSTRSRSRPQ
jgi:hypothetical protein